MFLNCRESLSGQHRYFQLASSIFFVSVFYLFSIIQIHFLNLLKACNRDISGQTWISSVTSALHFAEQGQHIAFMIILAFSSTKIVCSCWTCATWPAFSSWMSRFLRTIEVGWRSCSRVSFHHSQIAGPDLFDVLKIASPCKWWGCFSVFAIWTGIVPHVGLISRRYSTPGLPWASAFRSSGCQTVEANLVQHRLYRLKSLRVNH